VTLTQYVEWLTWLGAAMASITLIVVVVERAAFAYGTLRERRIERRYRPLVQQALDGDGAALRALQINPGRHRLDIARLLITPLIDDREPRRIARVRLLVQELALMPYADRRARSWRWWRRALALRAMGLIQARNRTAAIVAGLDDPDLDVRAAALDALADLKDPASLQAIVVRLNDVSLPRGRRLAALSVFGTDAEARVIELAGIDPAHRSDYALALSACGSDRSREILAEWANDPRAEVRAAVFEALGILGLDERGARLAIEALGSAEPAVRATAASALRGWIGPGGAAAQLAARLDDTWTVAVQAARSLEAMGAAGTAALRQARPQSEQGVFLAGQIIWEANER
jgi:hypothetical protein